MLLFVVIAATGLWLGLGGVPYPAVLFTVHKLIALLATVLTAVAFFRVFRETGLSGFVVSFLIVSAFLAAALFVSGAFLSVGRASHAYLLRAIHLTATAIIVIALIFVAFVAGRF